MQISIVTPDSTIFEGEARGLTLPSPEGSFQVFENHAALISSLGKGNLTIHTSTNESYKIEGGAIEVSNNNVTVLVEAVLS